MLRYFPVLVACVAVIACGVVHGFWTDRWVKGAEPTQAADGYILAELDWGALREAGQGRVLGEKAASRRVQGGGVLKVAGPASRLQSSGAASSSGKRRAVREEKPVVAGLGRAGEMVRLGREGVMPSSVQSSVAARSRASSVQN